MGQHVRAPVIRERQRCTAHGHLSRTPALTRHLYREARGFMYRLSARQILLIALISGLFAAGGVLTFDRIQKRFEPSQAAFTEAPPAGIADPSTVTDEQNNIEVYRTLSPGVVFIHSTS